MKSKVVRSSSCFIFAKCSCALLFVCHHTNVKKSQLFIYLFSVCGVCFFALGRLNFSNGAHSISFARLPISLSECVPGRARARVHFKPRYCYCLLAVCGTLTVELVDNARATYHVCVCFCTHENLLLRYGQGQNNSVEERESNIIMKEPSPNIQREKK